MGERDIISIMAGIPSARRLYWFTPQGLNGREPAVFNLIVDAQGCYVPTKPYYCISFSIPPRKIIGKSALV